MERDFYKKYLKKKVGRGGGASGGEGGETYRDRNGDEDRNRR